MSRASRSMDERLRKMGGQGSNLDRRLHRHAGESKRWHEAWSSPHSDAPTLRGPYRGRGGTGCLDGSVDEESLRLLKAMRKQMEETTGRAVDAGAAAKSLGMYPGTLDRSLLYLVRDGYVEEYAERAMISRDGMCLITLQGIAAIDSAK